MRSGWSLTLPFFYPLAAALSSDEARVFLFPSSPRALPNRGQKLDAETARLVFSRRLGLAQYYNVGDLKDEQLQQISAFGGSPSGLLDLQHITAANQQSQGFIVVEGFDNVQDVVPTTLESGSYDEFTIPISPSAADTLELMESFDDKLRYLESIDTTIMPAVCDSIHDVVNRQGITPMRQTCKPWSFSSATSLKDAQSAKDVKATLGQLLTEANQHNYQFTVVFTSPKSKKASKRSPNVYGEIPSRHGKQELEMILSEATPIRSSATSKPTHSGTPSTNDTSPVRGILPSCFASEADCEAKTKGCSGHGQCRTKYKTDKTECWTCACEAQVHTNLDGSNKTTSFGGPACQKKDIVMPFWLFTGFTIAFLSILTWAIGLLYSMGEQELPGVINAGVSGPSKK
ncbi:hypothetical protein EJ05DRAFT_504413 [Pseudovirgaria hyperparasitica]|uniref:Uncharacterized protein n=1 Tax=Pseudovirgaria hyperparasitica TaxID=470096 RepID=A0A6A6VZT2_9PEZI|nr:uncharacterized protein EJ05DRAFT_504413 [Pseudovirgaria hyperparasitica]KAF2754321.1 hypothetical protein EJ05DRAFT_504413 [Pseudovirgaria hyperparasitica]